LRVESAPAVLVIGTAVPGGIPEGAKLIAATAVAVAAPRCRLPLKTGALV